MSNDKKRRQGGMDVSYGQIDTTDERNKQAEEFLFQAWEAAGYHGQAGADFYPRTARETNTMEQLLNQAEASVDDPSDHELMEALAETRDVIDWSRRRHWTFAWWVVLCVAVVGCYHFYRVGGREEAVQRNEKLTDEQVRQMLDKYMADNQSAIARYQEVLACDTLSAESRKRYEGYLKDVTNSLEKYQGHTVESYKKELVERAEQRMSGTRKSGVWCFIWIVLYILACRPRGYMITKRRRENAMASGAKKVLFGIAGGLVGAAGALQVTETVTTWSDGSKTREDDSMIITFMKFGFIAAAVLLVLFAARIVIVIATLLGALRNYDWKLLLTHPAGMLNELK